MSSTVRRISVSGASQVHDIAFKNYGSHHRVEKLQELRGASVETFVWSLRTRPVTAVAFILEHRRCWRPRHKTSKSGLGSTGTTDWCCLPEKIQIACCRARRGSGTHGEGLSMATHGIARTMAACPSGQNCVRCARSKFVTHLTVPFLRKLGQPASVLLKLFTRFRLFLPTEYEAVPAFCCCLLLL